MRHYVMRNLLCDFAPLLAPDPRLWSIFGDVIPQTYPGGCSQFSGGIPGFAGRDHYAANPWMNDIRSYSHQRQPAGLGDPTPNTTCDLTIAIDNPFAFYNPAPGFPRLPAQTPTWISNVTTGTLNPPGTYVDPNTGNPANIAARLEVGSAPVLGVFGPFAPCVGTTATTYQVSQYGVGDSATGCPDEVPDFLWAQGVGIRINCLRGANPLTGVGAGNLQTFLMYSRTAPLDDEDARAQGMRLENEEAALTGSELPEQRIRPVSRQRLRDAMLRLMEASGRR